MYDLWHGSNHKRTVIVPVRNFQLGSSSDIASYEAAVMVQTHIRTALLHSCLNSSSGVKPISLAEGLRTAAYSWSIRLTKSLTTHRSLGQLSASRFCRPKRHVSVMAEASVVGSKQVVWCGHSQNPRIRCVEPIWLVEVGVDGGVENYETTWKSSLMFCVTHQGPPLLCLRNRVWMHH
jgi:hypothetical protein